MKNLGLIAFLFISLDAFSQSDYETKTEEIISITEDSTYLQESNVGFCDLPEVTRGDGDSLVKHHIFIDVNQTSPRYSLKTENRFDFDHCNTHDNKVRAAIRNAQYGLLPIKVRFTEKLITYKGSSMDVPFCKKEHVNLIETDVINIHYSNVLIIAERTCP